MTKYAPADCDLCPALVKSRSRIVEGRGTGGYLMFVGLAPGEDEDEKGKPFVGQSGKLLALLSQAAGIALGDLYLANAIRCHPAGNRRPKVNEIRACRPFLIEEIEWFSQCFPGVRAGDRIDRVQLDCPWHGAGGQVPLELCDDGRLGYRRRHNPRKRAVGQGELAVSNAKSQNRDSAHVPPEKQGDTLGNRRPSPASANSAQNDHMEEVPAGDDTYADGEGKPAHIGRRATRKSACNNEDSGPRSDISAPRTADKSAASGCRRDNADTPSHAEAPDHNPDSSYPQCTCRTSKSQAVVVTLGDVALQSALGRATTLGSVLGQTLTQPETGIPLVPTYHPAYLLRGQWQVADLVTGHIEKAREIADGERAEPHIGEYETADTIEKLRLLRDYLLHPDTTEIAFDCVTPETPILTADLRWVAAGELSAGQELFCFDEDTPGPNGTRRYRRGCVLQTGRRTEPVYEVRLSSGETLRCTGAHRWLVGGGDKAAKGRLNWVRTDAMAHRLIHPRRNGKCTHYRIPRLFRMWADDNSRDAGLLAGLFDADGTLSGKSRKSRWGEGAHRSTPNLTGKNPDVLCEAKEALSSRGFDFGFGSYVATGFGHGVVPRIWIRGGFPEELRFLGQIRPRRLLTKWRTDDTVRGHMVQSREWIAIESITLIGEREIVALGTDTKTYIAAGFPAHNTETTGLDWRTDELLCISFATQPGEGFVVPILSHRSVPQPEVPKGRKTRPPWPVDAHWGEADWPEVLEILREIFASDIKKVGQNIIFDLRFLERSPDWPYVTAATAFGFEIKGRIEDTMLLHHAIAEAAMPAEARRSKRSSLTILAAQYSDLPYYEEEINAATSNKRRMADASDEMRHEYGAADADAVERVAVPLRAKAEAEGTLWASEQIIQPLVRCCWEMEKRGVLVDEDYFGRLCEHYQERIDDAEARLWAIKLPKSKAPWKYLHSGALQRVLFQELKLPPSGIKTDSSRGCEACDAGLCFEHEGTGKDALAIVEAQTDHPIIPILRELKELRKAQSTSLDGGRGGFKRHIEADGRIRSQYRPGGAETSRLASADPNMQNVPKDVIIEELDTKNAFRQMFVAPEGYGLMEADWSQLEVWVLAYTLAEVIGENTLLEVLQSGRDIHTWAARNIARRTEGGLDEELSDLEWKTEHPDLRGRAKPFVFGANYGLTAEGLVQKGVVDTVEEAAELIDAYIDTVPGLRAYHQYVRRCILEDGFLQNKFEQRRHFPSAALLKACRRANDLEALIREGYAYPIQSGGSTLHSAADHLTEFSPVLKKRDCRPVISVHDSLAFEFHWPSDDYAETTARIIKSLWEQTAATLPLADGSRLGWQIPVDVKWGRSWGELDCTITAKGSRLEE